MNIEVIGALGIIAAASLVILVTRLTGPRRRSASEPAALSAADERLLPYLLLTPAQWRSLTDFQRADLRQRAHRSMN